ncbi:MAG: hypothetical protein A2V86_04215 [Deltaproteobacteria bacterium RBG_16_49_23]|nr:MAG: hypothetical protein A2V86_04215 [Deltaproteobacteria bacterium RBG_16_49_23]
MNEQIRNEIERIEESARRLQTLAQDNPAILRNADILLTFVYILKFITPVGRLDPATGGKEES